MQRHRAVGPPESDGVQASAAVAVPTPDEPDTGELIRLLQGGDPSAFEVLMRRFERLVFGTALRILGRPEDARDVAQEVFLRLHRYAGSLDPDRPLAPWFYRVTVNACRDAGRRNAAAPIAVPDADLERVGGGIEGGAEAGVLAVQRRRLLRQALQQLPERERLALVLRDVEGLDTGEVARILGTSEVTVRTQVSRGRVKLKHVVDRMLKGTRP